MTLSRLKRSDITRNIPLEIDCLTCNLKSTTVKKREDQRRRMSVFMSRLFFYFAAVEFSDDFFQLRAFLAAEQQIFGFVRFFFGARSERVFQTINRQARCGGVDFHNGFVWGVKHTSFRRQSDSIKKPNKKPNNKSNPFFNQKFSRSRTSFPANPFSGRRFLGL